LYEWERCAKKGCGLRDSTATSQPFSLLKMDSNHLALQCPSDTTASIKILSRWNSYCSSKLLPTNSFCDLEIEVFLFKRRPLVIHSCSLAYLFKSAASTLSEQPPSRGIRYCILSSHHQGRLMSFDSCFLNGRFLFSWLKFTYLLEFVT
jgi:hypothetical protein